MPNEIYISKLPASVIANINIVPPPPGQVSNFINPLDCGSQSRIAMYLMLPLMGISLIARLYTRARITGTFGADDCK